MHSLLVKGPCAWRRLGTLCLALVCVLSCGSQDKLLLEEVSPRETAYGSPARLLLNGSFAPDLSVDLGSSTPPSLENRFTVRIGPELAYDVRFVSRDTLEATAPATLSPGRHDVTVTDVQGRSSTLHGIFEVIDRGVHRLAFVTSMRSAHPNEWTDPLRIELRDLSGQPVPTTTPRTLYITSDSLTGQFARLGNLDETHSQLKVTLEPGQTGVDLQYRDSTSGYHTLESSSRDLPLITQTVGVGRLGPPAQVRFTEVPDAPLMAGQSVTLALQVLDGSGEPASLPANGIQLEVSTNSPGGGLALTDKDSYHSKLSLTLKPPQQGYLNLLYRDIRSSEEVVLKATAFSLDPVAPINSHSVTLVVKPGPTSRFDVVRTSTTPPQVGVPERLTLQALDEWGNRTPFSGQVVLTPQAPDPDFTPHSVDMIKGLVVTNVEFTRVQTVSSVQVTAPNLRDVKGASDTFPVRSGPPIQLKVSTVDRTQAAGKPFPLTIEALDRFGNPVDTPTTVALSAPGIPVGALSPTTSGSFTGTITLPVTITSARDDTRIDLVEASGVLRASTGGFNVLPGATQRFLVDDSPGEKTAGVPFRVHIRAVDAHGNTTRDVHDLKLAGEQIHTHQFFPTTLPGFQGQGDVDITITLATTGSISGTRVLVESGTSASGIIKGQQVGTFLVRAADISQFYLEGPPSCVTTTTPWLLSITARDRFANIVPSYTGKVLLTVSPSSFSITPGTTSAFDKGVRKESVVLNVAAGSPLPNCVNIVATDSTNGTRTGNQCITLQKSCAASN